ncbi:zinc-ribbon domain-containing protein [Salipiger sp.]|uniref:zinc-ribbon domain-containing protein n=1 Tax=Salipiger sp. TaxID=2078585 RepID=UPI003A9766A9
MRLICPNCGAQYEVPTEVIPSGGRDVQCSSCGHTWYQAHPDDDPELAEEQGLGEDETGLGFDPEPEPAPEVVPHRRTRAAPPPAPAPEPDDEDDEPEEEEEAPVSAPEPVAKPKPRGLDPSVAEVLREEAEREARHRASRTNTLESQPDLGLMEPDEDEAARRTREARDRMARMRGEPPASERPAEREVSGGAAAAAAAGTRRELLPDIEEINQTLRASSERRSVETVQGRAAIEEERDRRGGGFGRGFRMVLALAVIAIAVYVLAPKIVDIFPGAAPALDVYLDKVDMLRLWLDGQIRVLLPSEGGTAGN